MGRVRISYDSEANAAYIYFVQEIGVGEATETVPFFDPDTGLEVIVDLDADRKILGFEVLSASQQLRTETLGLADDATR